jgi:sulfatase maturation enzyme AslB (radical SAM superfamily)
MMGLDFFRRSVELAAGYGRFLIDVFEDWVRRDIGEVHVQLFDVALASWYGEPPGLCVHSRAGPAANGNAATRSPPPPASGPRDRTSSWCRRW